MLLCKYRRRHKARLFPADQSRGFSGRADLADEILHFPDASDAPSFYAQPTNQHSDEVTFQMSAEASPSPPPSLSIRSPSSSRTSLDVPANNNSISSSRPANSRRNRAALRDYYGIKSSTEDANNNGGTSQPSTQQLPTVLGELDREGFDAAAYVKNLLEKESLDSVLKVEGALVSEIRGLDGERKALVYDNYSKLIAATDTIQKVGIVALSFKSNAKYSQGNRCARIWTLSHRLLRRSHLRYPTLRRQPRCSPKSSLSMSHEQTILPPSRGIRKRCKQFAGCSTRQRVLDNGLEKTEGQRQRANGPPFAVYWINGKASTELWK